MVRILNRVMKKIHLTKFIESGDRQVIPMFPKVFGKGFKEYYLTREEISFVEQIIESKGKKFKNYAYCSEYAPWAGSRKYERMQGNEIQEYLSKFKKHCQY